MSNGQVLDIENRKSPIWCLDRYRAIDCGELGRSRKARGSSWAAQHFSMRPANGWCRSLERRHHRLSLMANPSLIPKRWLWPLHPWLQSGMHPVVRKDRLHPEIKRLVDIIDEAKTSGRNRQIALAKNSSKSGLTMSGKLEPLGWLADQGVLVANDKLQNVPAVAGNDWPLRTPGDTSRAVFLFTLNSSGGQFLFWSDPLKRLSRHFWMLIYIIKRLLLLPFLLIFSVIAFLWSKLLRLSNQLHCWIGSIRLLNGKGSNWRAACTIRPWSAPCLQYFKWMGESWPET